MRPRDCRTLLLAILAIFLGSLPISAAERAPNPLPASVPDQPTVVTRTSRQGDWLIVDTENFSVCCPYDHPQAQTLATKCEELRRHLQETWLGKPADKWVPRCHVVLHRTVRGYSRELGPGSEQSSGCATLDIQSGQVKGRRIDLRADATDWLDCALPHELTHVIVADRFTRRQIPRWADEGLSILSETSANQQRRRKAMHAGLARVSGFRAEELFSLKDYPAAQRRDAFYGQSASLVAFLIDRESPEAFLRFVEVAMERGYSQALTEVYQLESAERLDSQWSPRVQEQGATAQLLAERVSQITSATAAD